MGNEDKVGGKILYPCSHGSSISFHFFPDYLSTSLHRSTVSVITTNRLFCVIFSINTTVQCLLVQVALQ